MVGREELPDGPDDRTALRNAHGGERHAVGTRAVESLVAAHAALVSRVDLCREELEAVAGALSGGAVAAARLELSHLARSLDAAEERATALARENEGLRAALHAASTAHDAIALKAAALAAERDSLAAELAKMRALVAGGRPALPKEGMSCTEISDAAGEAHLATAEPRGGNLGADLRNMATRRVSRAHAIPEDSAPQGTLPLSPGHSDAQAPPQAAVRESSLRQDSGSETVGPPPDHPEGSSQTLSAAGAPADEGPHRHRGLLGSVQARLLSPEEEKPLGEPDAAGVREPRLEFCAAKGQWHGAPEAQDADGGGSAKGDAIGRWTSRTSPNTKARMRQSRLGLRGGIGPNRLGITPHRNLQPSKKALKCRSRKKTSVVSVSHDGKGLYGQNGSEFVARPQGDQQRTCGAVAGGMGTLTDGTRMPLEGNVQGDHLQASCSHIRSERNDASGAPVAGTRYGDTQASTSKSRVLAWLQQHGSSQPGIGADDDVRRALEYESGAESDDECTLLENRSAAFAQERRTKWRCTKQKVREDEPEDNSGNDDFLETPRQKAAENGNIGARATQRKSEARSVQVFVDADVDLRQSTLAGKDMHREHLSGETNCQGTVQDRDPRGSNGPLSTLAPANVNSRSVTKCGVRGPYPTERAEDGPETAVHQPSPEPGERGKHAASGPAYKYKDVVRRKEEREGLAAGDCAECRQFYDAIMAEDPAGLLAPRCEHHQAASRHRYRFAPPSTPSGFWNIGFDSGI